MSNTTIPTDCYNNDDLKRKLDIVSMVVYSLAFVLGVTGNGLVIFITGFRMKKTVNTVWFLNLAIADFMFAFFLPLNIVRLTLGRHWPFGLALCKINSSITHLNMYASVYILMVISIDCCISVRLPVWAQNHRSPRLSSFVVLGVWILALVLCSPRLYFRMIAIDYWSKNNRSVCYDYFGERNSTVRAITHQAVNSFQFIFGFIIPFGVILCSYGAVLTRLRRNRLSTSNKPFKVITAVIVAFFVCWFPFYVFILLDTQVSKQPHLTCTVFYGASLSYSMAFLTKIIPSCISLWGTISKNFYSAPYPRLLRMCSLTRAASTQQTPGAVRRLSWSQRSPAYIPEQKQEENLAAHRSSLEGKELGLLEWPQ